jgi:sulfide:quinone oxidoreductase
MSVIPRIVVLGGGFAGLTLCTQLDALASEGLAQVTLVERTPSMSVGGLNQFVLRRQVHASDVPMRYSGGTELRCPSVRFLCDEVTDINVKEREVHTRSEVLDYDYLAIATGATYAPEVIPGLATSAYNICSLQDTLQLRDALDRFQGGRIVMSIPQLPYKCPPAPQEFILIVETLLREAGNGLREKTDLVFTTEAEGPFPLTTFFKKRFEDYGIRIVEFAPVKEVETNKKRLVFGTGRDGNCAEPMSFDLLMATFPLAAPSAFQSLCDASRLIPSDPRSMRTEWDGVWALGDCARMILTSGPMHPKAGGFAVVQAEALAENLEALVRSDSKSDAGAENLGISKCDAEVGNNEGAMVSVNLMGGPTSQFDLGPVTKEAVEDKLQWICDSLEVWFKKKPKF